MLPLTIVVFVLSVCLLLALSFHSYWQNHVLDRQCDGLVYPHWWQNLLFALAFVGVVLSVSFM